MVISDNFGGQFLTGGNIGGYFKVSVGIGVFGQVIIFNFAHFFKNILDLFQAFNGFDILHHYIKFGGRVDSGIDRFHQLLGGRFTGGGNGLLRHIYLRRGDKTGEIMVCLVINADKMPASEKLAAEVVEKFPSVTSVMLNVNKKNTNVILGKKFICIGGNDYIIDELCGLNFKISAGSFYQVNRDGAELLYGLARQRAALTGGEVLIDLYCGTGTIGLSMARFARSLVGIEIVPEAVECARENAARNGIGNATFICNDAGDAQVILSACGGKRPDVAVIDPPRKGSTEALVKCFAELGS